MSEETPIRAKERDAIIQSLGAGVVPRVGQRHIQVGRAAEVTALLKDIDRIGDGGAGIRFIIGEYGSGKTFFLYLLRSIALEKKLVSTHAAAPVSSRAFDRLHEKVRRWVWRQQWTILRDVQEASVEPILAGQTDLIVMAATAGGKTEAAFLPICSKLVDEPRASVRALYVSPLKALINDQFERLDYLCEHLEIPVHRWHGDVAAGKKRNLLKHPSGILLITPESLEALFVIHGTQIRRIFSDLAYVVVDELHSFIGNERGRQLQSLLHRLEQSIRRSVPRIALSATLGDADAAAEFLRPRGGGRVEIIRSADGGQEIRLQLRGYRMTAPVLSKQEISAAQQRGQDVEIEDRVNGDRPLCIMLVMLSTIDAA